MTITGWAAHRTIHCTTWALEDVHFFLIHQSNKFDKRREWAKAAKISEFRQVSLCLEEVPQELFEIPKILDF